MTSLFSICIIRSEDLGDLFLKTNINKFLMISYAIHQIDTLR